MQIFQPILHIIPNDICVRMTQSNSLDFLKEKINVS